MSEQNLFSQQQTEFSEEEFRKQSERELATIEAKKSAPDILPSQKEIEAVGGNAFSNTQSFEFAQRVALMLSKSSIVPKDYQGPDKVGNCVIALDMANRMGISVFTVMQNLDIIYGRPSWRSSYIIAAINTNPKFKGALRFEYSGEVGTDDRGCRAVILSKDGEKLEGPLVTMGMAKAEGWYAKNGSKWKTMPELMMSYRAASFFGRLYCPEILNGLQTVEEVIDITSEVEIEPMTPINELE